MANNPHYRDLMRQARRDHLVNIRQVSGQIASLYEDAAKDLSSQAASMKKRTLSHRWATEYADALDKRARELRAGLYDVTYQGLKRSANLPIAADGDFWEAVGGQSFRDMFAVTPDDILTNLITGQIYQDNKGLSDRIWTASKTFEHDIDYMVNRGIAEHKSAYELAKDLEQYVKPKAKRDWDWGKVYPHLAGKQIDYNAQRLARTAINHSYFLANQKVCVQNPYVEVMHWELSDAHLFRQVIPFGPDECDDYAEHDEGFGMGNWKPEEIPLPHPQCLCVQYGVVPESLEAIGDEIGRWIAGESIPRLDRWNALYGQNYDRQIPSVFGFRDLKSGSKDITDEYKAKATPGKGTISYDDDYEIGKHHDEINMAKWLHDTYGGNIKLLAEDKARKVKTPDYEWKGHFWELKTNTSINAIDGGVRSGVKQIAPNPGGLIIDCRQSALSMQDSEKIISTIINRLDRSKTQTIDVIILLDDTDDGTMIIRYK